MKKTMNVKELRDEMIDVFKKLRTKEVGISEAKALSNVAGKIMSTAKSELEYKKFTGDNNNEIKFFKSDE